MLSGLKKTIEHLHITPFVHAPSPVPRGVAIAHWHVLGHDSIGDDFWALPAGNGLQCSPRSLRRHPQNRTSTANVNPQSSSQTQCGIGARVLTWIMIAFRVVPRTSISFAPVMYKSRSSAFNSVFVASKSKSA